MLYATLFTLATFGAIVGGYDLPSNLRDIYNKHREGSCDNPLSDESSSGAVFCGDIDGALFLKGSSGNYDNMDIDCDGIDDKAGDCSNDPTGYGETAFKDTVSSYGIEDLNANIHSYVVFNEPPYFNPENFGMKPLSVMAVVCDHQVFYGVWGDTNTEPTTGEASIALAKQCFPDEGLSGNNGHGPKDVMYIGFTSGDAVPGGDGAAWDASNAQEFEDSIAELGAQLVAGLSA